MFLSLYVVDMLLHVALRTHAATCKERLRTPAAVNECEDDLLIIAW